MAFQIRRSRRLKHWLNVIICFLAPLSSAHAIRVPAYVFPDPKSDIITYVEVRPEQNDHFPSVLDSSLEGDWYWSTYKGDFVGYVNKREVINRNQLKEGTLIRTNPTYRSWVLTKYERGDKVRIRSRLSVGRVSFEKEIPVYFQMPDMEDLQKTPPSQAIASTSTIHQDQPTVIGEPKPKQAEAHESVAVEPIQDPVDQEDVNDASRVESEPATSVAAELPEETHQPDPPVQHQLAAFPEMVETPKTETIDPLLEEKPRISAQELVNLAPPPADLFQEFEGFLRVVAANDAMADRFQYQLETRSGQRIVYVEVDQLRGDSYQDYMDQWINIRGSLDEVGKDFTLFIQAKSIWIAPEE